MNVVIKLPPKESLRPITVVSLHGKAHQMQRRMEDGSRYRRDDDIETFWIDAKAERMIHGVISTTTRSSNGQVFNPAGCQFQLPIPLLSCHAFKKDKREKITDSLDEAKIGSIVLIRRSPVQVYIQATLDDTRAGEMMWDLIAKGETRCLSIGSGKVKLRGIVEGVRYYDEWEFREGSVVRKGANPDCWCEPYWPDRHAGT